MSELTNLILWTQKNGNVGDKGKQALANLVESVIQPLSNYVRLLTSNTIAVGLEQAPETITDTFVKLCIAVEEYAESGGEIRVLSEMADTWMAAVRDGRTAFKPSAQLQWKKQLGILLRHPGKAGTELYSAVQSNLKDCFKEANDNAIDQNIMKFVVSNGCQDVYIAEYAAGNGEFLHGEGFGSAKDDYVKDIVATGISKPGVPGDLFGSFLTDGQGDMLESFQWKTKNTPRAVLDALAELAKKNQTNNEDEVTDLPFDASPKLLVSAHDAEQKTSIVIRRTPKGLTAHKKDSNDDAVIIAPHDPTVVNQFILNGGNQSCVVVKVEPQVPKGGKPQTITASCNALLAGFNGEFQFENVQMSSCSRDEPVEVMFRWRGSVKWHQTVRSKWAEDTTSNEAT